jgi:hypothetical protein
MLELGELSLFLTEDIYLIKEDTVPVVAPIPATPLVEETEPEAELEEVIAETPAPVVPPKATPIHYNPVLFVFDKELTGVPEETFKKLVNNGLVLDEKSYSVITQEQVDFTKPEEVNSTKIVLFDVPFSGYHTKYKVASNDKQLILFVDSMERIAENQDLKRQLWTQLQLMFPKN